MERVSALSLADHMAAGSLAPLNRARVRAALAGCDELDGLARRLACEMLLDRAQQYLCAIDYCGPGYTMAGAEYPAALSKVETYDRQRDGWYRQGMNVMSGRESALFAGASAMCMHSLFSVAEWELSAVVVEASTALRSARHALTAAMWAPQFSGCNWRASQRRVGTPGARRMLRHLRMQLDRASVGVKSSYQSVIVDAGREHQVRGVMIWSWPLPDRRVRAEAA